MNGSLARKLIISFFYSKSSIGFSYKSKLVGEGTWASLAHFLLEAEEEKPLENTYAFCLHQFGVFHLHGLWNFGHFIQVIYKMAQEKDMCSSSPARTPKLQLTAKQPSSGEWWIPPKKKDTPCPRAKEKPQQDGRRGKITFRIKPHNHQRSSECAKPCAHQESSQGLSQTCLWVFEHLLWRYRSAMACCRGRDSGCSRPGCDISPLGGSCHQTHHRATRIYTGLGNRLLEGTN